MSVDVGQYKSVQLNYIQKLYKKLGKDFDLESMAKLSRNDLRHETNVCRAQLQITAKNGKKKGLVF